MGSKTGHTAQGHWGLVWGPCWTCLGLRLDQLRGVAGGDWSLDVKTTDWVDFLGFLGTSLFVIYDMENDCQGQSFRLKKMNKVPSSIFSPEFQFLRGYSSARRNFRLGRSFCL